LVLRVPVSNVGKEDSMNRQGVKFCWFNLVAFCLSRAFAAALALALLITTASVALALVEGADTAQASVADGHSISAGSAPTLP
jgi:hypothetical protein